MSTRALRGEVLEANLELGRNALAQLTWGNASGIDRGRGLVAIKPSGIPYQKLTVETIIVVDLDGAVIEGTLRPSSDTLTHVGLYRAFSAIGGITHTHSRFATAFAQAEREIPCFGTTHADHFYGPVPVTRVLTPEETEFEYEVNTARAIVECLTDVDPLSIPAVLVAQHGPFTWGVDAMDSVRNAVALEAVSQLALDTLALAPAVTPTPRHLLERHYTRKHGPNAYYGNATIE